MSYFYVFTTRVAIHVGMYYNFARPHKTLVNPYPTTPAMAAGISTHIWTVEEIVKLSSNVLELTN